MWRQAAASSGYQVTAMRQPEGLPFGWPPLGGRHPLVAATSFNLATSWLLPGHLLAGCHCQLPPSHLLAASWLLATLWLTAAWPLPGRHLAECHLAGCLLATIWLPPGHLLAGHCQQSWVSAKLCVRRGICKMVMY